MSQIAAITRRSALVTMAGAAGAVIARGAGGDPQTSTAPATETAKGKGRLKQSVCKWCYSRMSLDDLSRNAAAMGIRSVELLGPDDWPTVKRYGLTCAMASGPSGIVEGWNRAADHDKLVKESERLLPLVAEAGLPNMIVFSGNRRGLSDAEGLENCARGLKRITKLAEDRGVTVCMELLNSKVDHKDYQCDHTTWGVELVKRVGSQRFKLLYDIYHMQIMEGDVIRTIQDNIAHIGHFHTGGVPGRNEIDETQELNYARIAQAIVDTGFQGFFAHEFIPKRDPMTSLQQAVRLCQV
jgi:hydroxypyruvate isomerase